MDFNKKFDFPDDTEASVQLEGLLGGSYISILPGGSDVTLLNNGGDSCYLVKDAPIPIGSSLVAVGGDQKVVMNAADVIKVSSSAATSIDVALSILEIT